jgi:hypothetical protein
MLMRFNSLLYILAAVALFCASCAGPTAGPAQATASTPAADTIRKDSVQAAPDTTSADDEYSVLYVVVADTGLDYYPLMRHMYAIAAGMHYPVDTMDRHYDKVKDRIVLPDTIDDELYRGEYYPRRTCESNLSLEYYGLYDTATTEKTIALVAGIYEARTSADSLATLVRPFAAKVFVRRAKVYQGCLH